MPRGLPPLSPKEVVAILLARGFSYSRTRGDHEFYAGNWSGQRRLVQVDMGISMYNDADMIKMLLTQSGMTRKEFYGATPVTAKKIGLHIKK